jgi:THO complex subunit 1
MDFTLSAADAKWVEETWTRAMEEMKATTPNGKAVADTVAVVLERERNWVRVFLSGCPFGWVFILICLCV